MFVLPGENSKTCVRSNKAGVSDKGRCYSIDQGIVKPFGKSKAGKVREGGE
jgi:hypothetical protein